MRAKKGVKAFRAPEYELGISVLALANKYAGIRLPSVPAKAKNIQSFRSIVLKYLKKKKTATEPAKTNLRDATCQ